MWRRGWGHSRHIVEATGRRTATQNLPNVQVNGGLPHHVGGRAALASAALAMPRIKWHRTTARQQRRQRTVPGILIASVMVCAHSVTIISVIRSYPPKLRRQRVFALQRVGTASYPAPVTLEQVIVLRRNSRSRQPGRRAPADRRTWHLRSPRRCSGPAD